MNPEGKQTLNTETDLRKKLQVFYEQDDDARASQNSAFGQTQQPEQPSPYLPGETPEQFEQRMIATVPNITAEKLAKWKKSSPHLFPPSQAPKPPLTEAQKKLAALKARSQNPAAPKQNIPQPSKTNPNTSPPSAST